MRISDWSSDVCSSDLPRGVPPGSGGAASGRRPWNGPAPRTGRRSQSDNNCVESSNCRVFLRSDRTVAARPIKERSKRQRASAATGPAKAPNPRRQRLWRDIALILIAPLLLYLLASLLSFSPSDPGWSHSGSLTAPLHNVGGRVGAWLADVLLPLTGYVAYPLPVMLGALAWIALFGMDTDGAGAAALGPALPLVGLVRFLVSATGLLYLERTHVVEGK